MIGEAEVSQLERTIYEEPAYSAQGHCAARRLHGDNQLEALRCGLTGYVSKRCMEAGVPWLSAARAEFLRQDDGQPIGPFVLFRVHNIPVYPSDFNGIRDCREHIFMRGVLAQARSAMVAGMPPDVYPEPQPATQTIRIRPVEL